MTPLALDIIVGTILFFSMLVAYFRGIVKEVFTVVGLAAASYVSYKSGHLLVPQFNKWLHVPSAEVLADKGEKVEKLWGVLAPDVASKVFSYGGTFFFILIVASLISFFVSRTVKEMGLTLIDKLLGAGFGIARGFLIVFLLYVPCTFLIKAEKFPDWAKKSVSVPVLESTWQWADQKFEISKKIEDHGDGIAIKIDKVDPDKIGEETPSEAEEDLKKNIEQEETETVAPDRSLPTIMNAPPEGELLPDEKK